MMHFHVYAVNTYLLKLELFSYYLGSLNRAKLDTVPVTLFPIRSELVIMRLILFKPHTCCDPEINKWWQSTIYSAIFTSSLSHHCTCERVSTMSALHWLMFLSVSSLSWVSLSLIIQVYRCTVSGLTWINYFIWSRTVKSLLIKTKPSFCVYKPLFQ